MQPLTYITVKGPGRPLVGRPQQMRECYERQFEGTYMRAILLCHRERNRLFLYLQGALLWWAITDSEDEAEFIFDRYKERIDYALRRLQEER